MNLPETRLQVVFGDLRRAIDDVIGKHQISIDEMFAAIGWLQQAADAGELPAAGILFFKAVLRATEGAAYAHPERDGASHWEMEGPAYRSGAPVLASPAVLPMRPDEPGEPLIVSGTVRSTVGDPLPGALLDVWQIDANCVYSGMMTGDFGPVNIPNDSTGIPEFNLRARIVADDAGRYEFRTVMPGTETLGFPPDRPLSALAQALALPGMRPLHIHSIVSATGCAPLTTQIYFDGDPLVSGTIGGPIPRSAVKTTERHEDPADYRARGLTAPYRALTYDYVLRPAAAAAMPTTASAPSGGNS